MLRELAGTNSKHYAFSIACTMYGMKGYPPPHSAELTNLVLIDPPKDGPSVWPLGDPFGIVTRGAITESLLCIDLPGGRM